MELGNINDAATERALLQAVSGMCTLDHKYGNLSNS